MKKQNLKNNKGITLIALVITIVVLLILAIVSINLIMNGGIIAHAEDAVEKYDIAQTDEQSQIAGAESFIDGILGGGNSGGSSVTYTDEGVPVPAGFKVVAGTKDTGLVIENETEGSQFVWVPVTEDISTTQYVSASAHSEPSVLDQSYEDSYGNTIYRYDGQESNLKTANCEDIDVDGTLEMSDFEIELKSIYKEMAESVNECDGFYVGRYEVSFNESRKAQSKGSTESVPVYSAINSYSTTNNNNAGNWYGLYALCKTYNTSSVKSSMIWGIQYDKMIEWMGADATNFDISKRNKDEQRRTGYVSTDMIRNVYDLGGNSLEWTLNRFGGYARIARGNYYKTSLDGDWTPNEEHLYLPTSDIGLNGSRLALYII